VKTTIQGATFKGDRSTTPWTHGYGHNYCLPLLRQTKYIKIDPSFLKNEEFFQQRKGRSIIFIKKKENTLAEFNHQGLRCAMT